MVDLSKNRVIHGQRSVVKFSDTLSVSDDEKLSTQVEAANAVEFTAAVMDATISDPEASVTLNNTFGGQIMTEEPSDLVEVDFTMRFQDIEAYEEMHGDMSSLTNDTEFSRISGTNAPGTRPLRGIFFHFEAGDSGSPDIVNYFMNNALFTQVGEISQDAESFAEVSITAVCRVKDRHIEQNF